MTTNEQQIASDGAKNLKKETGPQTPSRTGRESGIDVAGQKQWLERKLQELTQQAGV
jgi:hypothetical protein